MFRNTQNAISASGENNNLYYLTPNLASHLTGPRGPNAAEVPSVMNMASDSAAARLAASPADQSPLMDNMMADGEPDISDFKMRAVMIFTYIGFAFLTIVLLGTFLLSTYWTLSGSCSKSKQKDQKSTANGKKVQSGSCCSIDEAVSPMPSSTNGASNGSLNNGSQKKQKRKSSPKSSKHNGDYESVNCEDELVEWDRQTQVIEMEDL